MLAQSVTGHSTTALFRPRSAVKHALSPYCYRCPLGLKYPPCEIRCATDIEEIIQTTTTGRIAGMMVEPIQGVGGFTTPPLSTSKSPPVLSGNTEAYSISDEVQTGLGRLGGRWFGIEHWGVEPDILTMAGGHRERHALGFASQRPRLLIPSERRRSRPSEGTPCPRGGECRSGCDRGRSSGAKCRGAGRAASGGAFEELRRRHPKTIGDVRGMDRCRLWNWWWMKRRGDRTPNSDLTLRLFEETRKRGLLIGKSGLFGNAVRLRRR